MIYGLPIKWSAKSRCGSIPLFHKCRILKNNNSENSRDRFILTEPFLSAIRSSFYLSVLMVSVVVLSIYFADLPFPVDIVLVYIPRAAATEPTRRAVFAASAAIERRADDLLAFLLCGILDKYRLHRLFPLIYIIGKTSVSMYHSRNSDRRP